MSKIEEMIRDLCPEGVRWVKLGDVCDFITGFAFKASSFTTEGQPICKTTNIQNDKIDFSNMEYFHLEDYDACLDKYIIDFQDIVIGMSGSIKVGINVKHDICYLNQRVGKFIPNTKVLNNVFLYYVLLNSINLLCEGIAGGSVKNLSNNDVKNLSIPLPPLPIQEKIVEILEKFSLLSAELEAELEGRRKQYDFYRNRLLSFDSGSDSVQWKALGEVGEFIKGSGILKSDFVEDGFPCIHYGQVHTRFNTFAYKNISSISEELYTKCKKAHTGDLIIASTSEDVEACCKAVAWLGDYDVAVSGDAHIFRHNQNPKYVAYLFQTDMFQTQKRPCANGAKVVRVKSESMSKFRFPFPPLAEQERIVRFLDKFESLVTDLSAGLPAEIERVQKQYEYYRNLLLDFPEAKKQGPDISY